MEGRRAILVLIKNVVELYYSKYVYIINVNCCILNFTCGFAVPYHIPHNVTLLICINDRMDNKRNVLSLVNCNMFTIHRKHGNVFDLLHLVLRKNLLTSS